MSKLRSEPEFSTNFSTHGGSLVEGDVHTGGDFVGRDKVVHGDEVRGDKVGGDKIDVGNISGSHGFNIGGGSVDYTSSGLSAVDLDRLFVPLLQAVQHAPAGNQQEATQTVQELKAEAAKGEQADDGRMARLLDRLVDLVPGVATAAVSAFGAPLLSGIAGPMTQYALEQLRGR